MALPLIASQLIGSAIGGGGGGSSPLGSVTGGLFGGGGPGISSTGPINPNATTGGGVLSRKGFDPVPWILGGVILILAFKK